MVVSSGVTHDARFVKINPGSLRALVAVVVVIEFLRKGRIY